MLVEFAARAVCQVLIYYQRAYKMEKSHKSTNTDTIQGTIKSTNSNDSVEHLMDNDAINSELSFESESRPELKSNPWNLTWFGSLSLKTMIPNDKKVIQYYLILI